jgi:hypothetical protein
MRRRTRLALYLALVVALATPQTVFGAPERHRVSIWERAAGWLSALWTPLTGSLDGCEGAGYGSTSDSEAGDPSACGGGGAPPSDSTQGSPTGGSEQDGGPGSDPDG